MTIPEWWRRPRNISVVVDTPGWFDPFAENLVIWCRAEGHNVLFSRSSEEILSGGIAFYLSCMKLVGQHILDKNFQNIIVHASALPHGRGFSPLPWQILAGEKRIPISMILAEIGADAGAIIATDHMEFEGYELNDDMRNLLGATIVKMCVTYLSGPQPSIGVPQVGKPSWFRRRTPEDSRLDPHKTLADQFELLRVVDNERYPAFFDFRGHRYTLKIERNSGST